MSVTCLLLRCHRPRQLSDAVTTSEFWVVKLGKPSHKSSYQGVTAPHPHFLLPISLLISSDNVIRMLHHRYFVWHIVFSAVPLCIQDIHCEPGAMVNIPWIIQLISPSKTTILPPFLLVKPAIFAALQESPAALRHPGPFPPQRHLVQHLRRRRVGSAARGVERRRSGAGAGDAGGACREKHGERAASSDLWFFL